MNWTAIQYQSSTANMVSKERVRERQKERDRHKDRERQRQRQRQKQRETERERERKALKEIRYDAEGEHTLFSVRDRTGISGG